MVAWTPEGGGDPLRDSHDAEEECLFFVAMSRARDHLHLYRSTRAGSVRRQASKFLRRLRPPRATALEVRPAAALADGAVIRVDGPMPAEYPYYCKDCNITYHKFNVAEADRLLAEAGYRRNGAGKWMRMDGTPLRVEILGYVGSQGSIVRIEVARILARRTRRL